MKTMKISALLLVFTLLIGIVFSVSADIPDTEVADTNIFYKLLPTASKTSEDSHLEYITNTWKLEGSAGSKVYKEDGTDIAWVEFSLDKATKINKIFVKQEWVVSKAKPRTKVADIAVDVRLASGGWKRVAAAYNIQSFYSGNTFTFEAVSVLAVRISANCLRYDADSFCISEIEGYFDESITEYTEVQLPDDEKYTVFEAVPTMNLLAGVNGSSSNVNPDLSEQHPVANATDGKPDTVATVTREPSSNTAWLQFELPEAKTVNKVTFIQSDDEDYKVVKDFAVDIRFPNGMWKRVAAEYNISDASDEISLTFAAQKIEAFRLTAGTARTGGDRLSIVEIGIYNDICITSYSGIKTPDSAAYKLEMIFDKINVLRSLAAKYSKMSDWAVTNAPISNLTNGAKGNGDAHATVSNIDGTDNAWIQFDLPEAKLINKIFLQQKWNYSTNQALSKVADIAIDVKLDTGGWKRVAAEYNLSAFYSGHTITFEPVKALSIRITTNGKRNSMTYIALTEVEAYCDSTVTTYSGIKTVDNAAYAVPEVLSSMNLLSGIIATSSNTSTWYAENRPVNLLTDGITGPNAALASITSYGSTTHAWAQFDLPEAKTVNKVIVQQRAYNGGEFPRAFDLAVDVRLTDGTWQRVASEYNLSSTYQPTTFTFIPTKATAVRVTTNGRREASESFNVTEISAYYDSAITAYSGVKAPDDAMHLIPSVEDLNNVLLGIEATSSNTNTWAEENRPVTNLTNGVARSDSMPATISNCGTTGCAWLEFALTGAKDINKVVIQQRDYENGTFPQVKDIAVDVFVSGVGWQRVAEVYNIADTKKLTNITFPKVNVTKIRIVTSGKRTGSWGFNATEIEAYCDSRVAEYSGVNNPDDPLYKVIEVSSIKENIALENLIRTSTFSSSPSEIWLVNNRRLTYINDGESLSIARKYASAKFNNGLAWFTADMEGVKTINKVIVQSSMYDQAAADMAVDVKLADGSWKRVATLYNIQKLYDNVEFVFEPVQARAVRVSASGKRYNCVNFSVVEMVGYYDATATELTGNQTPDDIKYTVPEAKLRNNPAPKFDNLTTSGKGPYVPSP